VKVVVLLFNIIYPAFLAVLPILCYGKKVQAAPELNLWTVLMNLTEIKTVSHTYSQLFTT